MREVILEIEGPQGWVQVGSVSEVEPPGSVSSEAPVGRKVYLFGWYEDKPGIWALIGADIATSAFRKVMGQLDPVSDLSEPYVVQIYRRTYGGAQRAYIRFTLT